MNIALFPSAFHPHFGGVEELCRQLAHELRRRGHRVIVLTNRWPRDLPAFEEFEGIPVYRLPFRTREQSLKSKLSYYLTHRSIAARLLRILDVHAIDVLHVQCVSSNACYALRARKQSWRPLVVTLQGELTMDATHLFERSEWARATLRRCLQEAEIVTGCSTSTLRDAEIFYGRSLPDARTIFNAARIADFSGAEPWTHPRPYLFALGRMVPQKGFDVLLRAFLESRCSCDLVIAGNGPDLPSLKTLVVEMRLEGRVHLVGRADRGAVARYFRGCLFFVLPSTADEGLPVACAEAMAAGKAVVATDSGGVAEAIVDGENGLIVPKGDLSALSAALGRMCGDTGFRERAELLGRARAHLFDWATVTESYLEVYAVALARRGGPEGPRLDVNPPIQKQLPRG